MTYHLHQISGRALESVTFDAETAQWVELEPGAPRPTIEAAIRAQRRTG